MTEDNAIPRGKWIALCKLEDIPDGGCKGFALDNFHCFAVRQQGRLHFYRNACPHLGVPLEWVENQFLDTSGTMIQCANHGALFVIPTGQCVSGPCTGYKLEKISYLLIHEQIYLLPQ